MTSKCQPMRVNTMQNNLRYGMVRKPTQVQRRKPIHQGVYGNLNSNLSISNDALKREEEDV